MNERTNAFQFSQFKFSNFFFLSLLWELRMLLTVVVFYASTKVKQFCVYFCDIEKFLILTFHNRNSWDRNWFRETRSLRSLTFCTILSIICLTSSRVLPMGTQHFATKACSFFQELSMKKGKINPNTKRMKPVKMMARREWRDERKNQ